jgi:hypothetical protein
MAKSIIGDVYYGRFYQKRIRTDILLLSEKEGIIEYDSRYGPCQELVYNVDGQWVAK